MKVLHSISGLNLSSGGPSLCTWSLISGLRNAGIQAEIVTYKTGIIKDSIGHGDFVHGLPTPKYTRIGYSTQFNKFLNNNNFELYHGNGLWQYPVHAIAVYARKQKKPYIITPHGMLYPEGLKKSSYFKKIALPLYQRKDLEHAAVIHATCNQELQYIRDLGFTNPVAVIPNSIDIKISSKTEGHTTGKKQVGFVGRFAPIKNIENLIISWAETGKNIPDWELVFIGNGDSSYVIKLEQLASKHQIENIVFTGFLQGEEKEKALQSLSFLVLPSKSENFGMVVPEALIREIPVIASKGTPWEELNTNNAGWWIEIGVTPLAEAIQKALQTSEAERKQMGINGRKLVEENYSIESVAKKMIELYEWVLVGGDKPKFIF